VTPGKFDVETAKEMLGDNAARKLAEIGRAAAEAGDAKAPLAPSPKFAGYQARAMWGFKQAIIDDAFGRRKARLERMK
jgi:hypothetical protein